MAVSSEGKADSAELRTFVRKEVAVKRNWAN